MKMRVIEIGKYGPAEVLQMKEREIPTPAKGEVLIRVDASGVCRPDLVQRKGLNPPTPGASDILGLEVGGTIEACGLLSGNTESIKHAFLLQTLNQKTCYCTF